MDWEESEVILFDEVWITNSRVNVTGEMLGRDVSDQRVTR